MTELQTKNSGYRLDGAGNLDKSGKIPAHHVSCGTSLARHSSSREDAEVQRTNRPLGGAGERQRSRPEEEKEDNRLKQCKNNY